MTEEKYEGVSFRGSELERVELCPGSKSAEARLADTAGGEAAESGKNIHAALAKVVDFDTLKTAEAMQEAAEALAASLKLEDRERFVLVWFAGIVQKAIADRGGATQIVKEASGVIPLAGLDGRLAFVTGTPDLIVLTAAGVDVFEYKTGQGDQVTAEGHVQGQAYVVKAANYFNASHPDNVRLHVLAAGNPKGQQHTFTDYADEGLTYCEDRISKIVTAALDPKAARNVGLKQCRYCKAAGTVLCAESCHAVDKIAGNVLKMTDPVAIFLAMDPAGRAVVLERAVIASRVLKKIQDAAKDALQADPAFIPGWQIGPGEQSRSIPDARAAFKILNDGGFPAATFSACVKVGLADLKDAFHEYTVAKCKKETPDAKPPTKKSTAELLQTLLDPVTEKKQKAGSLEKVEVPAVS
jgi:hypothetical protein